jgi:hypothetical protein
MTPLQAEKGTGWIRRRAMAAAYHPSSLLPSSLLNFITRTAITISDLRQLKGTLKHSPIIGP